MQTVILTVGQVVSSHAALVDILKTKLPVLTSFRLGLVLKKLQDTTDSFNRERDKLLESCGTPVEGTPGQFRLEGEQIKQFNDSLSTLASASVTIEFQDKIKIASFGESADIPGAAIITLSDWLLEE